MLLVRSTPLERPDEMPPFGARAFRSRSSQCAIKQRYRAGFGGGRAICASGLALPSAREDYPSPKGESMISSGSRGPPGPKRVMLVDDHTVVRRGLRLLIESMSGCQVCAEASDGHEEIGRASCRDRVCQYV